MHGMTFIHQEQIEWWKAFISFKQVFKYPLNIYKPPQTAKLQQQSTFQVPCWLLCLLPFFMF